MSEVNCQLLSALVPSVGSWPYRRGDGAQLLAGSRSARAGIPYHNRLLRLAAGSVLVTLLVLPLASSAFEIKQAGNLQVSHDAPLFAFSTDPTIQEVLSQDFSAASRSAAGNRSTVTVSVNVTQQMLKPGVSLTQLAPGDPQVADLMKAAGANPPPLGDTGSQYDEAALARRMAAQNLMPNDTQSARMINSISNPAVIPRELVRQFHFPVPLKAWPGQDAHQCRRRASMQRPLGQSVTFSSTSSVGIRRRAYSVPGTIIMTMIPWSSRVRR